MSLTPDEIAEQALIEQSRDQRNFFEAVYGGELYPWQRDVLKALVNHKGLITFTPLTGKSAIHKEVERIRKQVHNTFKIPRHML